jgi:hypothetical protein
MDKSPFLPFNIPVQIPQKRILKMRQKAFPLHHMTVEVVEINVLELHRVTSVVRDAPFLRMAAG